MWFKDGVLSPDWKRVFPGRFSWLLCNAKSPLLRWLALKDTQLQRPLIDRMLLGGVEHQPAPQRVEYEPRHQYQHSHRGLVRKKQFFFLFWGGIAEHQSQFGLRYLRAR